MSVTFKFLSSAWLLGIPWEQLLSKSQNLPKSLRVQCYLCWPPLPRLYSHPKVKKQPCQWGARRLHDSGLDFGP